MYLLKSKWGLSGDMYLLKSKWGLSGDMYLLKSKWGLSGDPSYECLCKTKANGLIKGSNPLSYTYQWCSELHSSQNVL